MVCPQGECKEAIFTACPEVRQFSGNLTPGQVSVSPGFNLLCSTVLFIKCSKWKGGDGEQVSEADMDSK